MKIASISCLLLVLALGAESGPARAAETNKVPLVGSLRELDRFIFEGNNSFSGTNLWLGLNSTYDFPAQSHPLAPRDAFLSAIEGQLRLGYIHCGFPDARITARYDSKADRVVVRIQEGTRYQCGPVEVIGARKIPTQPIVEALTVTNACTEVLMQSFQFLDNAPANRTEAAETNSTKIWVAGQPAHFDDISLRYLSGKVTNTLAKHGFFQSRFTLNVVTNPAARLATLQVKILDEGPPATIYRINVVGNRKNSRKVMLNYLGLKPGMAFTGDLAAAMNDRLYHSARFLTNSVQASLPDASGRVKLTVAVVENNESPPLKDEFEPVDQVMLKTRDWLAKLGDSGEEAVFSVSGYSDGTCSVQCIVAPHRGLLMQENVMAGGTNRLRRALILSPSQLALYVAERQQKYVAHLSAAHQFTSYITMETEAPDADGHCGHFEAGAGMQSHTDTTNAPPYALSLSLAPAAFLRMAPGKNFTRRFDGDQLIISNADTVLKLDTRTGRIIGATLNAQKPHQPHMSLHFESNAFGSALAGVERDGAGFANVYRTNSPFGSALVFFGNELLQFPEVDVWLRARLPAKTYAQLPALLHRLGAEDFLAPWESFIHQHAGPDDPDEKFEIPEEPRPVMGGTFGAEITAVAQFVLECGDLILPPRSWPWTISRDFALLAHCQNYLESDLAELSHSENAGPIGCLVTAQISSNLKLTSAKPAALRGLQRLSAEAFRSDCRLFLDERYFVGQCAIPLAASLGNLNEQELDALVASVPASGADFVRDCARRVHAAPKGQPLFETLAPALDDYWEKEGRQKVADELKKLANK